MNTRLLLTTAVGLIFATTAFAQSPSGSTTSTGQSQAPSTTTPAPQKSPDPSVSQAPSGTSSTTAPASGSSSQAQTAPAPSTESGGTSGPSQAQTTAPPSASTQAPATGTTGTTSNQAQQAPAAGTTKSQAQQQAPAGGANTTAQQPAAGTSNTAQSPSANVNAQVNINDQQRTRVSQSIARLNVQPLTNVNFSLSVGTAVPRDVRLQTLPSDVVEIVPQYRGYSFFMVRDEIVIVEPSTLKIVTVLPRSGGSTAAAPARTQSKVSFSDKDRDAVRKHVRTRAERPASERQTTERQTTGSAARVEIRRGERLPEAVEVEEFPETVYRDAPTLRDYGYVRRENRTYLIEPRERRVIEDFD